MSKANTMQSNIQRGMLRVSLFVVFSLIVISVFLIAIIRSQTAYLLSLTEKEVERVSSEDIMKSIYNDMNDRVFVTAAQLNEAADAYISITSAISDSAHMVLTEDFNAEHELLPPDPQKDGEISAQVLYSEGVDPTDPEVEDEKRRLSAIYHRLTVTIQSNPEIYMAYVATEKGVIVMSDTQPSNKYDKNGNLKSIDVFNRPWYKRAKQTRKSVFLFQGKDYYADNSVYTWSIPVLSDDGEFLGAAAIDILSSRFNKVLEYYTSIDEEMDMCLFDNRGRMSYSTLKSGELSTNDNSWIDIRKSQNEQLAQVVKDAVMGNSGVKRLSVDDEKQVYLSYAPVENIKMYLMLILEEDKVIDPTDTMTESIRKISDRQNKRLKSVLIHGYIQLLFSFIVLLAAAYIVLRFLSYRLSSSLLLLSNKVVSYKQDTAFEWKKQREEDVNELAEAFLELTKRVEDHIFNVQLMTAEREQTHAQLLAASNIQHSLLPRIGSLEEKQEKFDLFASMNAAKEVGGDFYDFFWVDDDHLCLVMADVSDKGVPAALFMTASMTRIHHAVLAGGRPEEIFFRVNESICKDNEESLFVTVWLGIVELSTGKILASNAAHEYPVISDTDGCFSLFQDEHGFVIGGMEGMDYPGYEFELKKGSILFLYTDGVPEANNINGEQFGTERLIASLNNCKGLSCEELLSKVRGDISEFVGDANQFDDLTMMAFMRK